MGTHPIFESDFDCLTEEIEISNAARSGRPTVGGDVVVDWGE